MATNTSTEASKEFIKSLRSEIDEALAAIAKKHNLSMHAGNASFTPGSGDFTFKLDCKIIGSKDKYAVAYEQYQAMYELPDLGFTFEQAGKTYKTCGLRGSYVIVELVGTDKRFKFSPEAIAAKAKAAGVAVAKGSWSAVKSY